MSVGYVALTGNAGSFVDALDSAGLSVTGDLEQIACFEITDPLTDHDNSIIDKLVEAGVDGYRMIVLDDGDLLLSWGDGSADINKATTATGFVSSGTITWLRMTLDVSTGDWVMYTSFDPPDTDPGSVSWTQQASGSHGATSIADGTRDVRLGFRWDDSTVWAGKFYQARISDGGVVVANPNFTDGTQTSDSGATFDDDHGNTWTLQGDASWVEPKTDALAFFDITDLPADFNNAESASIEVRTRGVDIGASSVKLYAQLFQSDETTILSDEVLVREETTDSVFTNSTVFFTGLNTTAAKSVWDAARVRFRWSST